LVKQQFIIKKINEKIFNNSIVGQTIEVENNNFNSQFSKISKKNTKDLFVLNEESFDYKLKKYKKTKIRKLQIDNNSNNCDEWMTFCLPSNSIKEILEKEDSEKIGFNSQLNKNKNIAIKTNNTRKIFSQNSLDFELQVDDPISKRFRKLESNNLFINYNIRLKLPDIKRNSSVVGDSLCVQYNKNDQDNPNISCETWYDYLTNEVVCECQKQGLTINLIDKTMSQLGILKQFKISTIDFCNFYFKLLRI